MDPIAQYLLNFGGLGVTVAILWLLLREQSRTFREEMKAEREECERHINATLQRIDRIGDVLEKHFFREGAR